MPLESIPLMLRRAVREGYAVGYFESWNLESLQGVVDAAEQTMSPVILGFNGGFLSGPRHATERLSWYAALGRAAAESATVPCGLIFNECPRDDWVRSAIAAGFNLVMLADPEASPEDLTSRVAALTRLAHDRGVAVEAEVGELPCAANGHGDGRLIDRPGSGRGVRRGNGGRPLGGQRRQCPHPDRGRARSRLAQAGSDPRGAFHCRSCSTAGRASPLEHYEKPSRLVWPRSTMGPISSKIISRRSKRHSAGCRRTHIACLEWAARRMCWWLDDSRYETPCSSASAFSAAAGKRALDVPIRASVTTRG